MEISQARLAFGGIDLDRVEMADTGIRIHLYSLLEPQRERDRILAREDKWHFFSVSCRPAHFFSLYKVKAGERATVCDEWHTDSP